MFDGYTITELAEQSIALKHRDDCERFEWLVSLGIDDSKTVWAVHKEVRRLRRAKRAAA